MEPVAGPGLIGQLAAIAVGAYTEIEAVIAPSEAVAGDLVNVEVRVRNLADYPIYIATTGRYDGIDFAFAPEYATVGAGATYSFTFSLTMPSNDVRLHAWSFFWAETEWYPDDYAYVDIALAVPPEVYAGKISRKELEYNHVRSSIPVY